MDREREGGKKRGNVETTERDGKRSNLDIRIRDGHVIRRTMGGRNAVDSPADPIAQEELCGYFAWPNTTRAAA